MSAIGTFKRSHLSHFDFSSFDSQDQPFNEGLGHLLACRFYDPAERLPGNAHPLGGLLLIESLVIR